MLGIVNILLSFLFTGSVLSHIGSIYCDFTLRSNGFAGEYIQGSSVIAFKTHDHPVGAEAAVYIIRSPWDALVAEWNRQCNEKSSKRNITETEHSLSVGVEYFGK